ncbi:MAG TPA: uracil-DNA glycosylase family protein [Candidatus Limnocylindria bacterium]|nr:uracil-DNA glycosylase family protein [Candidatus Limnocylindria bacterium]
MRAEIAEALPKRVRFTGEWPLPTPRRAPPGTALRGLQDAMPPCADGSRPVLSGDGRERAMLIGQAPGHREIALGLPFAGDAGKRLVGWLGLAGVTVGDFRDRWYVTSVGKCYPGRADGASADRAPSRSEVARWAPVLAEEIRLVRPDLVLLVGGLAHRFAFGEEARLDRLVGRELHCDRAPGASVLCLPHPSGASTWLYEPAHVELWRRAIALLAAQWAALGSRSP